MPYGSLVCVCVSAVPTEWRLHALLYMVMLPLIKLHTNHYLTFIWDLFPVVLLFYFLSIFIVSPSYLSLTFIIT